MTPDWRQPAFDAIRDLLRLAEAPLRYEALVWRATYAALAAVRPPGAVQDDDPAPTEVEARDKATEGAARARAIYRVRAGDITTAERED